MNVTPTENRRRLDRLKSAAMIALLAAQAWGPAVASLRAEPVRMICDDKNHHAAVGTDDRSGWLCAQERPP